MSIDVGSLTAKQKTIYDMWVNITKKSAEDPELEKLLGLVPKANSRVRKEQIEAKEAIAREAEAVLLHLRSENTLMQKVCPECHLPFATNYHFAARCSDECITTSLGKIGIKWNPEKSAMERWNGPDTVGEIPAIITPTTLKFLKNWARTILSWDITGTEEEQFTKAIDREVEALKHELATATDWPPADFYAGEAEPESEVQEPRLVGSVPSVLDDDPFGDI